MKKKRNKNRKKKNRRPLKKKPSKQLVNKKRRKKRFKKKLVRKKKSKKKQIGPNKENLLIKITRIQEKITSGLKLEFKFNFLTLDRKIEKFFQGIESKINKFKNARAEAFKKIHPDVSPELAKLASIVNEAKDVAIKDAI